MVHRIYENIFIWMHEGHVLTAMFYTIARINILEIHDETANEMVMRRAHFSKSEFSYLQYKFKEISNYKKKFDKNALY